MIEEKNNDNWLCLGVFSAFYACNGSCGIHFFIRHPIKLKYLLVDFGLNLTVKYWQKNSAFLQAVQIAGWSCVS